MGEDEDEFEEDYASFLGATRRAAASSAQARSAPRMPPPGSGPHRAGGDEVGRWSVGSSEVCDVLVDAPSVAPVHADLVLYAAGWATVEPVGGLVVVESRRGVMRRQVVERGRPARFVRGDVVVLGTARLPWR